MAGPETVFAPSFTGTSELRSPNRAGTFVEGTNQLRDFEDATQASGEGELHTLLEPAEIRVPYLFSSPHSGRRYSASFIASSRLDAFTLRKSEDCYVDELFASVVALGAPLLKAEFPRAWLDVNREPWELDSGMFEGTLPFEVNNNSARVRGGLGTIARIVSESEEIYAGKLPTTEALNRIQNHYMPYHAVLRQQLASIAVRFGHAVLIDCHSMPSTSGHVERTRKVGLLGRDPSRADFILGDRFGTSCAPELTRAAAALLREQGYNVAINKPYAGGFITEHYGQPEYGLHALQIEINRGLYMNEKTFQRTAGFDALARDLRTFAARLVSIPEAGLRPSFPIAAE